MKNPFTWVEIYVDNMSRAQKFYETVLKLEMVPMESPGEMNDLEMISFPWDENGRGISGALCKMKDMGPGSNGTIVYFACEDCATELSRVEAAGGKLYQEKFAIGPYGFCGIAADTEGNTIGFHSMK